MAVHASVSFLTTVASDPGLTVGMNLDPVGEMSGLHWGSLSFIAEGTDS